MNDYLLFELVFNVFLELTKIAVSSFASFNNGNTLSFSSNSSSVTNSNHIADSSASSITIDNFATNAALDCANNAAL